MEGYLQLDCLLLLFHLYAPVTRKRRSREKWQYFGRIQSLTSCRYPSFSVVYI